MSQEHLACASVPIQHWSGTYDPKKAFYTGTIFPDLDKPFFASEKAEETGNPSLKTASPDRRESFMQQIQEISFFADDLRLFLDTHPECHEALQALKRVLKQRKSLLINYAEEYYPLTVDCMAAIFEDKPDSDCYCWQEGPLPWEGACV